MLSTHKPQLSYCKHRVGVPVRCPAMIFERCVRPRRETQATDSATGPASSGPHLIQFHNAKLVTEAGLVEGDLWMHGSRLVDPQAHFWDRSHTKAADRRVDCQGMIIAPGMIDVMLHEAFGVDFTSCGEGGPERDAEVASQFAMVRQRLPELGVTAFCPAIRATKPEVFARAAARLQRTTRSSRDIHGEMQADGAWAQCLGVHFDGPFFDAKYAEEAGLSSSAILESIEGSALDDAYDGKALDAAIITLAPEL